MRVRRVCGCLGAVGVGMREGVNETLVRGALLVTSSVK